MNDEELNKLKEAFGLFDFNEINKVSDSLKKVQEFYQPDLSRIAGAMNKFSKYNKSSITGVASIYKNLEQLDYLNQSSFIPALKQIADSQNVLGKSLISIVKQIEDADLFNHTILTSAVLNTADLHDIGIINRSLFDDIHNGLLESFSSIHFPEIKNVFESSNFFERINFPDFEIINDNIKTNDFEYSRSELTSEIQQFINESKRKKENLFKELIDESEVIDRQSIDRTTSLRKFAIQCMIQILLSIISAIIFYTYIQPYLIFTHDKEIRRHIVDELKDEIIKNNSKGKLVNLRYVKATKLNVRYKNTTKSQVLDTLFLGEVVEILDNRKKWAYIQYKIEDGNNNYGWVFKKYLGKFK